ncbi:FMN-dependent 2-nitropropane dioxygenase [Cercophora scortea]|uniref:FMN-dependent 2-nitropropane dioxygenase n=1 Tax=Cercophora scortea TaxID=314031 RepID=A0AAE0MGN9_9PEZI|nr:FMN-dependent 2-nitropropane dioxygenase [Cercophora scortea]
MGSPTTSTTTTPAAADGKTGVSKLNALFPHTVNPVIVSAPMFWTTNGVISAEVSKAGGIGIIPAGFLFQPGSYQLTDLATELKAARETLGLADEPQTRIPVGVGFILAHPSTEHFLETALPVLQTHLPQAVWLFAPNPQDVAAGKIRRIIEALHASGFVVMYQVGTVATARGAAADGADVIIAQGIDAGGHQNAAGAGIVSLVPEVVDMLKAEFADKETVALAAGGVADGRGVAAALQLGADGVVLGSRFCLAKEAWTPEFRRKLIQETVDGGTSTIKSTFHDDIQATAIWPSVYDGRAIRGPYFEDHVAGVSFEENLKRYEVAKENKDNSRLVTWMGTGVGLINADAQPAAEIVRELREEAKERIRSLHSAFQ